MKFLLSRILSALDDGAWRTIRLVNRRVAAAGIGTAMAFGSLISAGSATASVEGFLLEMDSPFASPEEQLAQGNSFCAALTKGGSQQLSGPAAADIITKLSDYNASQGRAGIYAIKLMKAAVNELCPDNKDFFIKAALAYDAQAGE